MNGNIECDTDRLKDTARRLINELAELDTSINKFFNKLSNITVTGEWTGTNAKKYADKVALDKEIYLSYIDSVRTIAKEMENFADKTENVIRLNQADAQR